MPNRYYRAAAVLAALALASLAGQAFDQKAATDPLPSWNEGPAKKAILDFVRATTTRSSPQYVPPAERVATFDQDGTLWVEQPMYTEVVFALDQVAEMAAKHPDWKSKEPFKTVLGGDRAAVARLSMKDLQEVVNATHTGMSVDTFQTTVKGWLGKARHPRWKRPYTELVYQPMLELMRYLGDSGFRTYIVTGSGQGFVRTYAEKTFGLPLQRIIGSAYETQFTYDREGKSVLMRGPKELLNNNFSGKPEDIYLFTGRRPQAAFGNSTGDREMLEYTTAGDGARLGVLILHDDAKREYAYGPAEGLPDSKVGTFTQALYDEAKKRGWVVIRIKDDWKRVFPFEK